MANSVKSVRGGSGLGDAIYVHGVVRHLLARHPRLTVCTAYPDVYRPLRERLRFEPFRRHPVDIIAHYASARVKAGTSQFQDCCLSAGLPPDLDFRVDWTPQNLALVARLRSAGRPVIVVQMPRAPFARSDGFGAEFLPDCRRIQQAIDMIDGRALTVLIGAGEASFRYSNIDVDLTNKTSVAEVMDVGFAADGFLGQCSFIIPLAEALFKPVTLIWSRRGLRSPHEVIRQMTPAKILHRESSRAVIDDCSEGALKAAIDALCDESDRTRAA